MTSRATKARLKTVLDERVEKSRQVRAAKIAAAPIVQMTVQERLSSLLIGLLGGPGGGGPDEHHLLGAAKAFLLLEQTGTPHTGPDELTRALSGDNVYETDFLDLARKNFSL